MHILSKKLTHRLIQYKVKYLKYKVWLEWIRGQIIGQQLALIKTVNVSGKLLTFCVSALLYTNIDQTLVHSLHGRLNCEIGGLDCCVITTEYRTRVHCIHV